MRLSRTSQYSIRALVALARHPERLRASHEIARDWGIPERYLLKILKPLVSAGILASVKGPGGGYRLTRAPKRITLLQILEAVEGPLRVVLALGDDRAVSATDRKLEAICARVLKVERQALAEITLAELA